MKEDASFAQQRHVKLMKIDNVGFLKISKIKFSLAKKFHESNGCEAILRIFLNPNGVEEWI